MKLVQVARRIRNIAVVTAFGAAICVSAQIAAHAGPAGVTASYTVAMDENPWPSTVTDENPWPLVVTDENPWPAPGDENPRASTVTDENPWPLVTDENPWPVPGDENPWPSTPTA
jgi:hypothetical protein